MAEVRIDAPLPGTIYCFGGKILAGDVDVYSDNSSESLEPSARVGAAEVSLGGGSPNFTSTEDVDLNEPGWITVTAAHGSEEAVPIDIAVVKFVGLSVSGHEKTSGINYVAYKTASAAYFTVTATLLPNDDICAAAKLTWGEDSGESVSPRQRRVDKSVVDKTVVTASCCSGGKTVNIWAIEITMTCPHGDPVNAPVENVNEFTFDDGYGELTLGLAASVTPSGAAAVVKSWCSFTADPINGSATAWLSLLASGDSLTQNVKYTGLPTANSSFGAKKAAVFFNGTKRDEENYEVFYPRDKSNHPGGVTPNWFYYWMQARPNANVVYVPTLTESGKTPGIAEWDYDVAPNKSRIEIGPYHPGEWRAYGVGKYYSGIDRLMATVIHEERHVAQIAGADSLMPTSNGADSFRYGWSWNRTHNHRSKGTDNQWGVAGENDDQATGNSVTDDAAPRPPFEPGWPGSDDVSLENASWTDWPNAWAVLPVFPVRPDLSMAEVDAIRYSDASVDEDDFAEQDWGHRGKNHGPYQNGRNWWDD